MSNNSCFHCGTTFKKSDEIIFDDKSFCCNGCKTVYEIFSENDLGCYYDYQNAPGASPLDIKGKYDYLDNAAIASKLLEFEEENLHIVSLYIPHIHCSSCIWILENLQRLNKNIHNSQVNFPEKKVRINYNPKGTSLKELVYLLSSIGYEPYISLENYEVSKNKADRSLIYKIGVAFFCFGNIMLLSFPEYFEVDEFWINQYRNFFRWLIFALSLPAFIYSASGYYISAYKSIKSGILNIDIPIALGIIVMFIRSTIDIVLDLGQGFFDSMTGLIFFMLLGKLFQQKTYDFLSFERDYKSYFPIAVTRVLPSGKEEAIQVYEIKKGDRLLIRNQELIPVDGILLSKNASIDYSFVTGEALPVEKVSGDKLFAGGKQIGKIIEIEVLFSVTQSYLTQLWSNDVFQKKVEQKHKTVTDNISRYFTPILLLIACIALIIWLFIDVKMAFNVFTAVLIVACPCALALTSPFTLGNVLRIMGKRKLYLKNALVIEQLSQVNTIVFDKTGTITYNTDNSIKNNTKLSNYEIDLLQNAIKGSNHPLSRRLYNFLPKENIYEVKSFEEIIGKGIVTNLENKTIKVGSKQFVSNTINDDSSNSSTQVHISINEEYKGYFTFANSYRNGLKELFESLNISYQLYILSGDNEAEKPFLEKLLPINTKMVFNKKPQEKLNFIKELQENNKNVLMIGDGLNDAGALAQSNVGISISENINVFSPACDGILDASQFKNISFFLNYSKNAMNTIYMSFTISLIYNIIGLSFALIGKLSPLFAAIIMPLSTITIVTFVTLMSNYYATKKMFK